LLVGVRGYVVELVQTRYADFAPTLAAEALLEKDGVKVSRETLRKWMIEDVQIFAALARTELMAIRNVFGSSPIVAFAKESH